MLRRVVHLIAVLAILLCTSTVARGQEPVPAPIGEVLVNQGQVQLVRPWRYHPGDDPQWADPAFDDSGWELVEPRLPPSAVRRRAVWQGAGWFRRHLRVDPTLWGRPLVIRVESAGATTVFLDGAPLMSTPASGVRTGRRITGGIWRETTFSHRADHVLAVRHRLFGRPGPGENLGFVLSVETTDAASHQLAAERLRTAMLAVFTAIPALLALLHLALFLAYRKARENLYYALAMAAFAAIVVADLGLGWWAGGSWNALADRLVVASILATIFFLLLTYYAVRTRAIPRTWIAFALVAAGLMLWIFLSPDPPSPWLWFLYFGLLIVEVIRVEASGRTVEREGVKVLLNGFAIMIAVILLQILVQLGAIPPFGAVIRPYLVGLLVVAVTMSLFLARSFGRTSLHLERRLDEVRALSEQVLSQERAAHQQELGRRLLEVENARKTAEIEAARALQLSMLPANLPVVEGLEIAAAMAPASEVGGDYYDFRVDPDGSLVVAFGDAAGHGVAAGIMVTAVKALFSTLGGGKSLAAVLVECDRVLREMYVKPLPMCLTLARLTPRSVVICSAAMPPALIYRAASGEIEELGTGGRPIGSRLAGVWNEQVAALAPGDSLLFASDGFAEQLDAADRALGYERMSELFRGASGLAPRELVERLAAQVASWRGDREQGDDITFVVIRAA